MNINQDRLDDAIDVIAARMTHVAEDDGLALRIANSLPERSEWLPFGWVARFALGALATIAVIVVLRSSGPAKTGHHSNAPAEASIASVTAAERSIGVTPVVSAFKRTIRRTGGGTTAAVDHPDHEFSLPPIGAVAALGVEALAPADLPEDAPLTIESLQIADLPLTPDFSPR